jgi:hypothetical protein
MNYSYRKHSGRLELEWQPAVKTLATGADKHRARVSS